MNSPTPVTLPNTSARPVPIRRLMSTAVGSVAVNDHDPVVYPKTQLKNVVLFPPRKPLPHQLPPKKRYVKFHGTQGVSSAPLEHKVSTASTAVADAVPQTADSLPSEPSSHQQLPPLNKRSTRMDNTPAPVVATKNEVPSSADPMSNTCSNKSITSNAGVSSPRQQRKRKEGGTSHKEQPSRKKRFSGRDDHLSAQLFEDQVSSYHAGSNQSFRIGDNVRINVNNDNVPKSAAKNEPPKKCFMQMLEEVEKPESDDRWFRVSFISYGEAPDCVVLHSSQALGFVTAMVECFPTYKFHLRPRCTTSDWGDEPIPSDKILNTFKCVLEFSDNGFAASFKKYTKVLDRYPAKWQAHS